MTAAGVGATDREATQMKRRDVLKGMALLTGQSIAGLTVSGHAALGQVVGAGSAPAASTPPNGIQPHPDWSTYQSGDFLWPAKPGALIVRSLARPEVRVIAPDVLVSVAPDVLADWTRERDAAVLALRDSSDATVRAQADTLAALTYPQFRALYYEGVDTTDQARTRSLGTSFGRVAVGHIAIIEIDGNGAPWVLEATPHKTARQYDIAYTRFPKGVLRTSYDEWIDEHDDYLVWHGRLRDTAPEARGKIAEIARGFVDRDYWFWSLNLADEKSFYCSKLAWLSATRALGQPLDAEVATDRSFWVTPKSIMGLKTVEMLHVPSEYGSGR
jgi:hypothetical protein